MAISFTVNGREVTAASDPETPLLYVLRDELGERTARFGCGAGSCGACTVVIDGVARQSCDTPLSAVAGATVRTSASLETPDGDHPILAALLRHRAAQCGYCLPGITMTALAFLTNNPGASRPQIAEALELNLCRCGAHFRILNALEEASAEMAGDAR